MGVFTNPETTMPNATTKTADLDDAPPTTVRWISNRMDIACRDHVPPIASEGWWAGGWRIMSEDEILGYTRTRGTEPECRACEAIAIAHLVEHGKTA